jgi:hypothetical protein
VIELIWTVEVRPSRSQVTVAVPAFASIAFTLPISPVLFLRTCPGASGVERLTTGAFGFGFGLGGAGDLCCGPGFGAGRRSGAFSFGSGFSSTSSSGTIRAPVPFVSLSRTQRFAITFESSHASVDSRGVSEQVVTLLVDQPGELANESYERLAEQLGDAEVGQPDPDTGVFDVTLDADSREEALNHVWNALAAAGADDEILFLEHADVPDHWRSRPA